MRELGTDRLSYGRREWLGWTGATLLGAWGLAGCAGAPKPVVTPVSLSLVGAADMNPDARGRASPLAVRVYALKTSAPFDAADFFALFEKDQATLGGELVHREEALLRPGDSRALKFTLPADAKALAFLAAYRDLERARWREVRPVQPGQPVNWQVAFGARQIRIDAVK
ncbi:type VI secretion system lipoprotein TssJ [Xenophilus sp. Marseille-Q4582]|uniref:type VI secretion system lipoprotein TssJ n=1 Tax=Xenophilus sp. Marseille-Q4582 TaxID=2866600 RepID=UPI001CE4127F|nr:type VI secretion system lipoprotein TssJ [Xenophilus sp. Marseille-Q4582]